MWAAEKSSPSGGWCHSQLGQAVSCACHSHFHLQRSSCMQVILLSRPTLMEKIRENVYSLQHEHDRPIMGCRLTVLASVVVICVIRVVFIGAGGGGCRHGSVWDQSVTGSMCKKSEHTQHV